MTGLNPHAVLFPKQMEPEGPKKVVFCIPVVGRPHQPCIDSLEACLPLLEKAGYKHELVQVLDNPYISAARASMLRAALDAKADYIVFIDYDLSWRPEDMLKLIETEGDVVAGTYRVKFDDEHYMGTIETFKDGSHAPVCRKSDGAISAMLVPAGFLKITKEAVDTFMVNYPELCYGPMFHQSVDLFNHGVHERIWWGEDYSFSRRWKDKCGPIWLIPDLNLDHNTKTKVFKGNFHQFLGRQGKK
jgi:glycosyltransferase involved in cell wall biosynthesis